MSSIALDEAMILHSDVKLDQADISESQLPYARDPYQNIVSAPGICIPRR